MSILLDESTKVMVQGITGSEGTFHSMQMIEYGTRVVCGVTPGKGGSMCNGVPVFNTAEQARKECEPDATVIFVPPMYAADSIMEAADAGIGLIVCITEGIPTLDVIEAFTFVQRKGCRLIGPNCPGIISPGKAKIGIMPGFIHKKGRIGVLSRSGTLTYEAVAQLTSVGLGQSTCIGLGGDMVIGTRFVDGLKLFKDDPETEAVVLIGEIGGTDEEDVVSYLETGFNKPLVAFVAGRTAPKGKRMGHAGAIIAGGKGAAGDKIAALKQSAVRVVDSPAMIGQEMKKLVDQA